MIPGTWIPYYRPSDGELAGYLSDTGDPSTPVVPRTLFGFALAEPSDRTAAIAVLEQRGLTCLAESWNYRRDDGTAAEVKIMAAYADQVVLSETVYGMVVPDAPRHVVESPTDRLSPFGRS